MRYKILILILIICYSCLRVNAQNALNQFDLKKMLPTSPEAAMLGRFGDIPVGYYTGVADVSIPLYTIRDGGLEIPVVLRYHGSGVKVDDLGSNVGLGWSLDPGGAIVQVINGVPDDRDMLTTAHSDGYEFLMNNQPVSGVTSSRYHIGNMVFVGDCYTHPPYVPGDDRITTDAVLAGHGQPDIYIFTLPGGTSGKFYLHPKTQVPIQLNKKEELTIERTVGGSFIITTLSGNIFTFNIDETTSGLVQVDHIGHTYKLGQILLTNGRSIDFTYTDGFYSWIIFNQTFHSDYALGVGYPDETRVKQTSDMSSHNTKNLSRITSNEVYVDFKYDDREDMITVPDNDGDASNGTLKAKKIKSVEIISRITGQKIKSYNFTYNYFAYHNGNGYHSSFSFPADVLGKRLKLVSVQEVGYNEAGQPVMTVPPYQFEYNESATMPMKTSYAKDFWGYYNGQNGNTTLLPDLTYQFYNGHHMKMPQQILYEHARANRAPRKQNADIYSLKKITYPTGGFSTFEYEPHSFYRFNYPDQDKMDSTRVFLDVQDQNEAYDVKSKRFKIAGILYAQLKITMSVTSGSIAQGLNFYNVSPATISLYKYTGGVRSLEQTWQLSPQQEPEFNINRGLTWSVVYDGLVYDSLELAVELPDNLGPQNDFNKGASVRAIAQYYDMRRLAEPRISYGGGLRIRSIKNYTETGKLAGNKVIRYVNADSLVSGKLMSGVLFTHDAEMSFIIKTYAGGGQYVVTGESRWVTFLAAENNIPFSDGAGGSPVGYSRVEELEYDGAGNYNGRRIFTYYNEESSSGPNTPDQPDYRNGQIVVDETRDASNNILSSSRYRYTRVAYNSSNMGIKATKNYIEAFDCDGVDGGPVRRENAYVYLYYPMRTEWFVLDSVERKEYAGSNALTVKEGYTYNANGLVIRKETNNSKGQTIRNQYAYYTEAQYTNEGQLLGIAGMQNTLIEEVRWKVEAGIASELARTYIQFKKVQDVVVRSAIRNAINGAALETDVTFDVYGAEGTLKQMTEHNKTSSLLWSERDVYPVAAASNATATQIAFTSFEDNAKGNWNYNQAAVTSTYGFTGGKSYSLSSSNAMGSNGLPDGDYIISYRSRNTSPFTINGTKGTVINGGTVNGWTYFQHTVSNYGAYTITGTGIIDDVRLYPVQAELITYVHRPGGGLVANTDIRGATLFYEYDAFNRLKLIRDQDGKIVKQFDYQYNVNP